VLVVVLDFLDRQQTEDDEHEYDQEIPRLNRARRRARFS
jgi:hypothetical protein